MYSVLVVDDEELEREAMARLVDWESLGCTLAGLAADGLEGLEMIRRLNPDIVVTDVRMPRMDGLAMIGTCLEEGFSPVFIVLSGYGEYEYTSVAMEHGARHYILKPIDEAKIASVVRRAVEEKKSLDEDERLRSVQDSRLRSLLPQARRNSFTRSL